jgi:hypothetical protein
MDAVTERPGESGSTVAVRQFRHVVPSFGDRCEVATRVADHRPDIDDAVEVAARIERAASRRLVPCLSARRPQRQAGGLVELAGDDLTHPGDPVRIHPRRWPSPRDACTRSPSPCSSPSVSPARRPSSRGLPVRRVTGLPDRGAPRAAGVGHPGGLDARVRPDRRRGPGDPLALLELPGCRARHPSSPTRSRRAAEAAARSGRPDLAHPSAQRLCDLAQLSGTEMALGLRARCLALLAAATGRRGPLP